MFANSIKYGLSAILWKSNIDRTMHLSKPSEAGIVWVTTWLHRDSHTPFDGIKQSDVGQEGGFTGLDFIDRSKKRIYFL